MISKNVYLALAILLFIPLLIIYFQNVAYGTSILVFFSDVNGSLVTYFWPLVLIAGSFGAIVTLYIQQFLRDIDIDNQAGGLNL